jgi:hypothetical protein
LGHTFDDIVSDTVVSSSTPVYQHSGRDTNNNKTDIYGRKIQIIKSRYTRHIPTYSLDDSTSSELPDIESDSITQHILFDSSSRDFAVEPVTPLQDPVPDDTNDTKDDRNELSRDSSILDTSDISSSGTDQSDATPVNHFRPISPPSEVTSLGIPVVTVPDVQRSCPKQCPVQIQNKISAFFPVRKSQRNTAVNNGAKADDMSKRTHIIQCIDLECINIVQNIGKFQYTASHVESLQKPFEENPNCPRGRKEKLGSEMGLDPEAVIVSFYFKILAT